MKIKNLFIFTALLLSVLLTTHAFSTLPHSRMGEGVAAYSYSKIIEVKPSIQTLLLAQKAESSFQVSLPFWTVAAGVFIVESLYFPPLQAYLPQRSRARFYRSMVKYQQNKSSLDSTS